VSPFLHRCPCLRGFFTLRPCDAETTGTCARCQRAVCRRHLGTSGACVDCAARADEDRLFDEEGDAWFYRSRHRYYTTHHYRPVYWSALGAQAGYDDYDLRSFDQRASDETTETAVPGGLEDS